MTRNEFEMIGNTVFGGNRWGRQMAAALAMSAGTISYIRSGKLKVTDKVAAKVQGLLPQPTIATTDSVGAETVSFGDTTLAGSAAFKLKLVAVDLTSNKFMKVTEVNPRLFFDHFAPTTPIVQYVAAAAKGAPVVADDDEALSDAAILARIETRVSVMDAIAHSVIYDNFPSMLVSGAPGVGKSFTIMAALAQASQKNPNLHIDVIKGAVSAPGLYKALYAARNGGVIVLDDSDNVFDDEETLNLLKAALDSGDERNISWRKNAAWLNEVAAEHNVDVADVRDFTFSGGVIFITNVDMKKKITDGNKMAKHYEALVSRSYYIDLTMNSTRAKVLRVRSVFLDKGMATGLGLTTDEANEIVEFMTVNRDNLSEVSLRMATLITKVYKTNRSNWQDIITVTKFKG